jgi:hypothetical protein
MRINLQDNPTKEDIIFKYYNDVNPFYDFELIRADDDQLAEIESEAYISHEFTITNVSASANESVCLSFID